MPEQSKKRCYHCKQWLEYSEFGPHRGHKDGLDSKCRPCNRKAAAEYKRRTDSPEKRERHNAYIRAWRGQLRAKHPHRIGDYLRKCKYGIPHGTYEAMQEAQSGRCGICHRKPDVPLGVDHEHTTGRIRGLLCGQCNRGIGIFEDDVRLLKRAIAYLSAPPWEASSSDSQTPSLQPSLWAGLVSSRPRMRRRGKSELASGW